MDRPPNQPNGNDGENGIVPVGNGEAELIRVLTSAISDLAEQDRQRNDIQREIALRSLEVAENAARLEHDLSIRRIEATDAQHRRRYGLGRLGIIFASIAFLLLLLPVAFVVAVAIYGNPMQSQTALTLLGYGFAAIGGGGILFLIMYVVNAFIKWWQGG